MAPRREKRLVAVFPANVYAALTAGTLHPAMPHVSALLAWVRLPLQPLLIAWAWWLGRHPVATDEIRPV